MPSVDAQDDGSDPLIGTVLAERYRVLRTLGEGGMGRVYLAEHVRMGRLSAVKVMAPALSPTADAISRFNREAANASRINHPNVAAIYDFGETADGTLYLAMEYVDGETLAALVRRTGSVPIALVGELTKQIADALNAAHQLGIIHRDLKPDNIIVGRDPDGRYQVKVVDFGIAKTMQGGGQTVTAVGSSIGTPAYMSPEQLAGDTLDARTDIYSLGLVVFTMLTGEAPFPDATSKQSLVARLTARPRALKDVRPGTVWPDRIQNALDRALSPEPDDRYRKVGDFAMDIGAAAAVSAESAQSVTRAMTPLGVAVIPEPTTIVRPPMSSRNGRRRTPLVVGGLAAAVVVALAVRGATGRVPAPVVSSDHPAAMTGTAQPASTPSGILPPAPVPETIGRVRTGAGATPQPKPPADGPSAKRALGTAASHKQDTLAGSTTASGVASNAPSGSAVSGAPAGSRELAIPTPEVIRDSVREGSQPVGAREVFAHLNRSRTLFASNQFGKAFPELRLAYDKYLAFAAGHPRSREAMIMRSQLKAVTDSVLASCPARSDTIASRDRRAVLCAALAQAAAQATETGRAGGMPFLPMRRQPRGAVRPVP